jgi:hypothetical protein
MGYLSDVTRRRVAAMLLLAAVALAVLAIEDVGPFSDPPTEQERAQAAVERFFDAAHEEDFGAACAQLTGKEQRTVEQLAGRLAFQQGLRRCEEILRGLLGTQLSGTRLAGIEDTRVSGNQAVVDAEIRPPGSKHGRPATFHLFLIGDEWKIDDLGA